MVFDYSCPEVFSCCVSVVSRAFSLLSFALSSHDLLLHQRNMTHFSDIVVKEQVLEEMKEKSRNPLIPSTFSASSDCKKLQEPQEELVQPHVYFHEESRLG